MPAVLYGGDLAPLALAVEARDLRHAMGGDAGLNALLSIKVDGSTYTAMARGVQRHPVKGTVIHVDFHLTDPDKPVVVDVPIALSGHAAKVHMAGGIVDQQIFSAQVRARPAAIPRSLVLDIEDLNMGSALRLSDVEVPEGVELVTDSETTVVVGLIPRGVKGGAEEEEGAKGAAGEGAAEGEAAQAGPGSTAGDGDGAAEASDAG